MIVKITYFSFHDLVPFIFPVFIGILTLIPLNSLAISGAIIPPGHSCIFCGLVRTTENNETQINPAYFDGFADVTQLNITYTQPTNGTLSGDSTNLTYIPNPGFIGVDNFVLQVQNASDPTNSSVTEMNVIVGPSEPQPPLSFFPFDFQLNSFRLWIVGAILMASSILGILIYIVRWVKTPAQFAIFSSYQFVFLTIFVIGHILTITFIPRELLGDNFPIATIPFTDSEGNTQWVLSIGGPLGMNQSNWLGIQIPIYVIVAGILGAYIRYLYIGIKEFKDSHKEDVFKLRDNKLDLEISKGQATTHSNVLPDTSTDRQKSYPNTKLKSEPEAESAYEKSIFELRFEVIDHTLTTVGFFFLAPLLAILAWLFLSIGGTDNQETFALVSFAIGLTTRTIVDRITSFVEQTVGTSPASSGKLTVKAKDENNVDFPGCLVTLTFDSSYKTGLTPFTFEGVSRSNAARKNVIVSIQQEKDDKEFQEWEDGGTSWERTLAFTGDTIITAAYNKKHAGATKTAGEEALPRVLNNSPPDGATEVSTTSPITALFSEAMSSPTINNKTFTVRKEDMPNPITGKMSLSPDGRTAEFYPEPDLSPSAKYIAEINEGAKDQTGNALVSAHRWSFSTGGPPTSYPSTNASTPVS